MLPKVVNFDSSKVFMEGVSGGSLLLSGKRYKGTLCPFAQQDLRMRHRFYAACFWSFARYSRGSYGMWRASPVRFAAAFFIPD